MYIIYCLISANMVGGNFALLPTLITRIYDLRYNNIIKEILLRFMDSFLQILD